MIKKREWLNLQTLVHDKVEFGKLSPLLQKQIFDFFRHSHNMNQKTEKIKNFQKKISQERGLIKKLSKFITSEFNYITNELSIGRQSIYITPEFTGKSYRVDIDWKGKRKKMTLGKTLQEVTELINSHHDKFNEKLTNENFKILIKKYLKGYIERKISSISRDRFEMLSRIVIDKETKDIVFIDKKDESEKKVDRPTKKSSSILYNSKLGGGSGSRQTTSSTISFIKTSNPFQKPTTVDDVPKKYQIKGVENRIKIPKKKK
jgi:hypothetical protein